MAPFCTALQPYLLEAVSGTHDNSAVGITHETQRSGFSHAMLINFLFGQVHAFNPNFEVLVEGVENAGDRRSPALQALEFESKVVDDGTIVVQANELGLTPLARIVSSGVSALNPEIMGLGPIDACRQAMGRAGMTIDDIEIEGEDTGGVKFKLSDYRGKVVVLYRRNPEARADLSNVSRASKAGR